LKLDLEKKSAQIKPIKIFTILLFPRGIVPSIATFKVEETSIFTVPEGDGRPEENTKLENHSSLISETKKLVT